MEHFESGIVCLITTSLMKLLIVIGSAWAYLSRNWCTIMWMFNITGIQFEVFVIMDTCTICTSIICALVASLFLTLFAIMLPTVLHILNFISTTTFQQHCKEMCKKCVEKGKKHQKTPQHHFWTQTCSLKRHFQFPDLLRIRLIVTGPRVVQFREKSCSYFQIGLALVRF